MNDFVASPSKDQLNRYLSPVQLSHQPYPKDWIGLARELAKEFRQQASQRDSQRIRPVEQVRRLRETGLVNLFYPAEFGGGGGSVHEAAWSVLEIARGDGSVGALLGFHFYNSAVPLYHDFIGHNAAIVRKAVENRWFWGNITQYVNRDFFAEPHPEGGYTLNGRKKWNTGAPLAEITTVLAEHSNRQHFIYGYLPTDRQGIRFEDDWDQIGLRGADSSSVVFDNVRLYADEVIPWKHAGAQLSALPFWTTFGAVYYSSVYLGSALAALDAASEFARNDTRQSILPGASSLAKDPLVLAQYGELWIKLQAALAYFDKVIEELQIGWDRRAQLSEQELGVLAAKTLALRSNSSQVALEITPRIFDFAGGRGSNQAFDFDRFWRDARTLASHDPVIYSLRTVGDFALNGDVVHFPSRFQSTAQGATVKGS